MTASGLRADRAKVAVRLGDRLLPALVRVGINVARRAVGGHRQRLAAAVDANHRGIAAGALDRVGADRLVILLPDPAAAGEVGRRHQLEQVGGDVGAFGNVAERLHLGPGLIVVEAHVRPFVARRVVGERAERDVAHYLAVPLEDHVARVGNFADHGEVELPLAEDLLGLGLAAGLQHHEHALLAFREHHFIGRHAGLAARHLVHVEADAGAALRRHLDRRGSEARRAHVLDGDDRVGRHQLEAGLDQQLLGERIADLDGRALLVAILVEIGRRHGRAMDAVAPGLRPDVDDRIADAGRGRIENLVGLRRRRRSSH